MLHRLSRSASAAFALWACVAASVICVRTAEAACGCSSSNGAEIFLPSSSGNSSANNDTSPHVSKSYKGFIRIDDMLIPKEDFEMTMSADGSSGGTRYSTSPRDYISCVRPWPNGRLFYRFSPTYPSAYKNLIRQSLSTLESRTSNLITFIESDYYTNVAHVTIINGDGCWSYVGKIYSSSSQNLSLEVPGCMYERIVQHEFMHALGFNHEQSRLDRDSYVQILWSNIQSDNCHNFEKTSHIIPRDFPGYDYKSVMHYGSTYFACFSGRYTVLSRTGSGIIGGSNNLTEYDVAKLKYTYSYSNLNYCFGASGSSVSGSWGHVASTCLLISVIHSVLG